MSESLPNPKGINEYLDTLAQNISSLLVDSPEVSDGVNLNRFDSTNDDEGTIYGVGLSVKANRSVNYHASLRDAPDASGFVESWDYHWGLGKPHVIHSRVHQSRLHSSSLMHPIDTREVEELALVDVQMNIPEIIDTYELSRRSQPTEVKNDEPN